MDHTDYLQLHQCLPLPRKHSPDGASPDWGCRHLITAYYSFIDLKRMSQLQVERRTAKLGWSKTNVLPPCHAANRYKVHVLWHYVTSDTIIVHFTFYWRTWLSPFLYSREQSSSTIRGFSILLHKHSQSAPRHSNSLSHHYWHRCCSWFTCTKHCWKFLTNTLKRWTLNRIDQSILTCQFL